MLTARDADLVFLHLSDIHFRKGRVGDVHDCNNFVRNELRTDLLRLTSTFNRLDGLFISGDIAFAGKPEEYEYAANWIESISEAIGCPPLGRMVTPGNHDSDRDQILTGGDVQQLHDYIRAAGSLAERDERLAAVLRDATRGEALLRPLAAYNEFARKYGCAITREQPYWQRDFDLSGGSKVRFRGLTTTLLSGPNDNEQTCKMTYGSAQRDVLREPGVRIVVVGHHPPSWCLEGDTADHTFGVLSILQAFGHKHDQWLTRNGSGVRLIAGAFHPDRGEPQWLPRYSAITFSALGNDRILLRVYPRRWSFEELTFIPDYDSHASDCREFSIDVEPSVAQINQRRR